MAMRSLYDKEYLDSGCTLPFDEISNVDDTVWTYATNFAIAAVCLPAGVCIVISSRSYLMPGFFVFVALSFVPSGFLHALIHSTEDYKQPLISIPGICLHISSTFMVMAVLPHVTKKKFVYWLVILVSVVVLVWEVGNSSFILLGLCHVGALLFMALITTIQTTGSCLAKPKAIDNAPALAIIKSLSGLIMIGGWFIQVILDGACGRPATEECFKDCPLPNPGVFNHNALFHLIYLFGVMGLGLAEYWVPSSDVV